MRKSYRDQMFPDPPRLSSQKYIKMLGSPSNSKIPRAGMGKNRSDLTGVKGISTRMKSNFSQCGALGKVQSNLSNKSTQKALGHGISKVSIETSDMKGSQKLGRYKLEKLLCKESNKSAVFSFTKGQNPPVFQFAFTPNSKEKRFTASRYNRDGRGNSPHLQYDQIKKGFYGSYTSSTLQTASMVHSESTNLFQVKTDSCARLCSTKLIDYEVEGDVFQVAHFEGEYACYDLAPPKGIHANIKSPDFMARCLRGYSIAERNESKFFQPKASVISVGPTDIEAGCAQFELSFESPHSAKRELCDLEYSLLDNIVQNQPSTYTQSMVDTPSFTAADHDIKGNKRDDFTFGKTDEGCLPPMQTESGISSVNNENDISEQMIEQAESERYENHRSKRISSHRSQIDPRSLTNANLDGPLSDRLNPRPKTIQHDFMYFAANENKPSTNQKLVPPISRADLSVLNSHCDQQTSAEDSERYNLYRHIQASDSDDQDLDMPLSLNMSESEGSSRKGRIYGETNEQQGLDTNQLFLDDELRSKYQSLLQHN